MSYLDNENNTNAPGSQEGNFAGNPMASPEQHEKKLERPGFMVYREAVYMMKFMTAADTGRVMQAVFSYFLNRTTPTEPLCVDNPAHEDMARHIFTKLCSDIDRDDIKYQKTVERNRKNIHKRWNK